MFVDTNVLVFAFDDSAKDKHERAKQFVSDVFTGKKGATLSNQVLGEFSSATQAKAKVPLEPEEVVAFIQTINENTYWKKVNYTTETTQHANGIAKTHHVPYWDAVIVATMKENGENVLLTDNVKDFQNVPWIQIKKL